MSVNMTLSFYNCTSNLQPFVKIVKAVALVLLIINVTCNTMTINNTDKSQQQLFNVYLRTIWVLQAINVIKQ